MRTTISVLAIVFLLLTGLSFGARAADESVDITPDLVSNIAKSFGPASLQTDSKGEPVIYGRISGHAYTILFNDCARESCSLVQFIASFHASDATLERLNDWNGDKRIGTASFSRNKVFLTHAVVSRFGLPRRTLERHFVLWQLVLEKAKPFFGGD